jgi:hypothetical protein
MIDINREVADFERRAEIAFTAMRKANGQIATFCRDDALFYLRRAIDIANRAAHKSTVARLRLRIRQISVAYARQQERIPPSRAGIERWENEGGATSA